MWTLLLWMACGAAVSTLQAAPPPPLSNARLLEEVQRRAFRFFWEKADPHTGLVNDRARNDGKDDYTVASIAATGYALAALPVAVEHRWITREQARRRAETTLHFLLTMPHVHGWLYHFVDRRTGARVWNCEVSTIDTSLLVLGALVCGQYLGGDIQRRTNDLYDRLDWRWMLTNGGAKSGKRVVSHGWTPEKGFIPNDWSSYCELMLLYLPGMGAKRGALAPESWTAWKRPLYRYAGVETLEGGPLFLHQMAHIYYDFRGKRDRAGWDYEVSARNATRIHHQYCRDHAGLRKTYREGYWGLNASDGPKGYMAYGVPGPEDGTVSPTGTLASILFTPDLSISAVQAMYRRLGDKIWGRFGFANAFNLDADWYDPDVIGIDLGMALLAIENHRSGLIWRLLASHPSTMRGMAVAGLRRTTEQSPRPLKREGVSSARTMVQEDGGRFQPSSRRGTKRR